MFFQNSVLVHYPHQLAAGEFQIVQWVLRKTEVAAAAMVAKALDNECQEDIYSLSQSKCTTCLYVLWLYQQSDMRHLTNI